MNTTSKHCAKQPNYEMIGSKPVSEASRNGNVVSLPGNRIAQSPKVTPRKPKSQDRRSRKYLTPDEVTRLKTAAKGLGRLGERDSLIILMMYRHALRVSELCDMRWEQLHLDRGEIYVNRVKNGSASVQKLEGDEIRALRKLKREQQPTSPFVFVSERKGPLSSRAIQMMIERAGIAAGIEFPVNAHALRHAAGFALANAGADTRSIQGYLGHKNIQHTVLYTQLASDRFKSFGSILGG